MKLREKEEAIRLRQKGYSLKEIAQELQVAKSTASLWVQNILLSLDARKRIEGNQTAGQQASLQTYLKRTRGRLDAAKEQAEQIVGQVLMTKELALLACALLYWCEGAKDHNDKTFAFSNSDPDMVRGFMRLLHKGVPLDEKKLRVHMHLHEYHNEKIQRAFWSSATSIPESQFTHTYWKPHTGKSIKRGYQGCIQIKYYDVNVSRLIHATARAFFKNVVR
jgi:transposase-like protein